MPQNTNLNASPYFDDFDSSKNFNRVLFKPGSPVQARELTTLQSILQGQIEKFGKHIFKEGSVVIPGSLGYDQEYTAVKVESTFFGVPVELYYDQFIGIKIKGKVSGVTARVVKVLSASKSETGHTTLYIKYETSGNNKSQQVFSDGENLFTTFPVTYGTTTIGGGSDFATCIESNATAIGSAFTITKGVFFARGAFVEVPTETIILDQYDPNPSFRVGFLVKEEIVTAVDDESLYDNAAGFSNFTAPGADRLKISLTLTKKELNNFQDENFIELFRSNNGKKESIVQNTVYSEIGKELARRTFDESGNYFVRKFDLQARECLNDRHSVFGTYFPEQKTNRGNVPSKNLLNIKIGPGKAYVKGFEAQVTGSRILDIEKPRTTKKITSSAIPFEAGNKLRVNNTLNGAQIKLNAASADFVDLRDTRLGATKSTAAGSSIGRARVYDYKTTNANYSGNDTQFDLYLFDIQTDTTVTINTTTTLAVPALIEGSRSGAKGYLKTAVSNSADLVITQTSGQFIVDEPIIINGVQDGKVVRSVSEKDLADVKSVRSTGGSRTFAADVVLEPKQDFGGRSFTITTGGVITSGSVGWVKNFKVGDIISYKLAGVTDNTFNQVSSINLTNRTVTVVAAPNDVSGVCDKDLPSSNVTVSGLQIVASSLKLSKSGFLYSELPNPNIESLDLTDSTIQFRIEVTGNSTDGNGQLDLPSLTGTEKVYTPFDEERYSIFYSDGTIETLTSDQFVLTNGSKGATISGLTASQSNVVIHTTQQKSKVKSKQKNLVRGKSLIVTGSDRSYSGVSTSIADGLTFSNAYGKRVQDREVSLDVADVVEVHAVYESSGTGAPTIPSLTLTSFTGPNGDNSDLILGEVGVGKSSGASAMVLARSGTNKVEVCFKNTSSFNETEEVVFQESGVIANLSQVAPGDPNIRNNFLIDSGQRSEYYDFGRLVRKQNFPKPQGQLKIYYDHYTINALDSGDVVSANSYSADRYDTVPIFDGVRNTDVIDLRPRVADYSGSKSPFEFDSRDFTNTGSASNVLVSDENILFDYNFYLPRIDRLYLNPDATFTVKKGIPAINPTEPEPLIDSFELARIDYKPYVYDAVKDVTITSRGNKRYTMKDIGRLETRIETLEEVTSLSLLETATESLVISDPDTGLDRFKNGFVVDTFNNFDVTDLSQSSLKYDIKDGNLVARKHNDSIDLLIGSEQIVGLNGTPDLTVDPRFANDLTSPNIQRTGDLITLSYNSIIIDQQPLASRVENVNPYMFRKYDGSLTLNPDSDVFVDRSFTTRDGGIGFGNDFISETEPLPLMREQNIQFVGVRLKPNTEHFCSFSGEDMIDSRNRVIPKLLEVTPIQGAFQIGETVRGTAVNNQETSQGTDFRFRLATPHHKDGPFNDPTVFFGTNPYSESVVGLTSAYSETTAVLNIDTASLNQKSDGNFFGQAQVGMRLVGETSGAEAEISDLRLVSDDLGALIGSVFIPGGTFQNGTNTLILTSLRPQDQIAGLNFSRAGADFFSEGFSISETTITRTEPTPPPPPPPVIINNTVIQEVEVPVIERVVEEIHVEVPVEVEVPVVQEIIITVPSPPPPPIIITETIEVIVEVPVAREEPTDDPLAQSFHVFEDPGIFMTAVDLFFQSKSETIPLEVRIAPIVNGYPSREIMKNSICILNPTDVNISEDASIPTRANFPSPVYLAKGEYAFVVLTFTDEYNQWISQVGEVDITTAGQPELGQVVISKQPTLGSLFKGQNAGTWTASQLEDMKYTAYKAQFTTDTGTFRMYNPHLGEFAERNQLPENPIETFSRRVVVGLGSAIEPGIIDIGTQIKQNNRTANGFVIEKLAHLDDGGSALTILNAGTGYEDGQFDAVSLVTVTGSGSGATANISVDGNVATAVTVTSTTGTGYVVGDTLTAALGTKGLGQNLTFNVGVTTGTNSLVLTNVSGNNFNTTDLIQYHNSSLGYGVTVNGIVPSTVTANSDQFDGKIFKVNHANHGMHDVNNVVKVAGITGDIVPTRLTVGYAVSQTNAVSIASSIGFNFFEGAQVSASNPGVALIGDEVITYTSVGSNQLTGTITRGLDSTFARTYNIDTPVQKYELSGVSLRKINKTHNMVDVSNTIVDKIALDSYHLKITGDVFFNKDKHGGGTRGRATSNIVFDTIEPNISASTPQGSVLTATVRTTSSTSVNGSETSFLDQGFEDVSLAGETSFTSSRMVASGENENVKPTLVALPGNKSFTMEMNLSTTNRDVSPVIDAFGSSVLTKASRINAPISNYTTDNRVNLSEDPHELLYQTKIIKLDNPSTSLKVLFAANRPSATDIRVLYRLERVDGNELDQIFELFPGFDNLDASGNVISEKNNSGRPDRNISPSLQNQFNEYEFSASNLPQFTGFQIKIVMSSTDQSQTPKLKDFRSIATA